MDILNTALIKNLSKRELISMLSKINLKLENYSANQRITWAIKHLPGQWVLSSSFGIQSSVLLHMITLKKPDIPVILIDTGYLFKETYRFIDELKEKLNLNLYIFRAHISPAWQEVRYGKLWEQGIEGLNKYNNINKIEPMKRALNDLNASTWFAGLRRDQANSRKKLQVLSIQNGRFKILPIIDWNNHKVFSYLNKYKLQYHPLYKEGYLSVGDIHTTKRWQPGMLEEHTRFFGLQRECGLHKN